jgi:hypothetical protein
MRKLLYVLIAFIFIGCQRETIKELCGIRSLYPYKGFIIKDKTKIKVTNLWNAYYLVGDTCYRFLGEKEGKIMRIDITRYDYEQYNIGDTIK